MAITAMGIGTKQAPDNVNLDPQRQFWSWLTPFMSPSDRTADSYHHQRAYFSGFNATQTEPAGMTIQIGGTAEADSAVLFIADGDKTKAVLLSTDGEPEVVTIPTAPASGSRIDTVVSYIDTTSADPEGETPGTPEYVKTIVVSGTTASSPSAPTDSQIVAALPAGANSRYYRWCDVKVAQNQTVITNSDITDKKPMSPNVYFTTSKTTPNFTFIKCTSTAFSGVKALASYTVERSGLYLLAYQLGVGSIGPSTRGIVTEFKLNGATLANTTMRNYMPGQGNAGAVTTMSCVWVGNLTQGQVVTVNGLAEMEQMEVQHGSMAVLEVPPIVTVS